MLQILKNLWILHKFLYQGPYIEHTDVNFQTNKHVYIPLICARGTWPGKRTPAIFYSRRECGKSNIYDMIP